MTGLAFYPDRAAAPQRDPPRDGPSAWLGAASGERRKHASKDLTALPDQPMKRGRERKQPRQIMGKSRSEASVASRIFNPYGLKPRSLVLYHVLMLALAIFTIDQIASFAFLPGEESREIVLVSSRSCPHSRAVKERLVDAAIPFREVSAEGEPFSRALASWAFQSLSVPIVVVGPEVIYGNRRDRIDEALAELGYDAPSAL